MWEISRFRRRHFFRSFRKWRVFVNRGLTGNTDFFFAHVRKRGKFSHTMQGKFPYSRIFEKVLGVGPTFTSGWKKSVFSKTDKNAENYIFSNKKIRSQPVTSPKILTIYSSRGKHPSFPASFARWILIFPFSLRSGKYLGKCREVSVHLGSHPDSVVTRGTGANEWGRAREKLGGYSLREKRRMPMRAALVMKERSSLNFLATEFWGLEVGLDDKEKPT